MKKMAKRFLSSLLVFCMAVGMMSTTALADEAISGHTLGKLAQLASKTIELSDRAENEYEITLSVPGAVDTGYYNEVIVMVDASLSQKNNFDNLKKLLKGIAAEALTDDSSIRLTLMGFGLGPRNAGSFYSLSQLEAFLETATQDDLLQERSATNCEVGFEFVEEYINNSPLLKKAYVVYTSDGAANLDETPMNWSEWADTTKFDYFRNFTKAQLLGYLIGTEVEHIFAGNAPLSSTLEMFPEECAAVAAADETNLMTAMDALYAAMNENADAYVSCTLRHILAASGMDYEGLHSASEVEKAFQTYFRNYPGLEDATYGSYMDVFYVLFGDSGSKILTNRYTRAAEASLRLQGNAKLEGLYHVGYSGASNTWMNPEKKVDFYTDKLTYVYNTSFAAVVDDLLSTMTRDWETEFNDVALSDYMSKWVTLQPETIRIYDGDAVICSYNEETGNYEWAEGVVPPTTKTPITVTKIDPADYAAGGPEVVGNVSGDICRIDWNIKDGALLATDNYSMRYMVTVDTAETGFEFSEYPNGLENPGDAPFVANGTTAVAYVDENGNPQSEEITVPVVDAPTPVVEEEEVLGDTEAPEFFEDEVLGDTESPKASDNNNMMVWGMIFLMAGFVVAGMTVKVKREER